MIHDALINIHGRADLLKLDGVTIQETEALLENRIPNLASRSQIADHLSAVYEFIRKNNFVPSLPEWKKPWRKQKCRAISTDIDWQQKRCPSMYQMIALADLFANPKSEEDRYWSSILVLLMFAPSRGSEVQHLITDCIHYYDNGLIGIKWLGGKGFGPTIKDVPKEMTEVVIEAVRRLVEIGAPARRMAKWAYENPGKFYIHSGCNTPKSFSGDRALNALDFAYANYFPENTIKKVLKNKDLNSTSAWNRVGGYRTKWVKQLLENGSISYDDLGKYYSEMYKGPRWPMMQKIDSPIWEALLLIRDREFHNTHGIREFSWIIPDINTLNHQLANRQARGKNGKMYYTSKSIFFRNDVKDEDGSDIELTSHQLRVWLSTHAERAGMDAWLLAKWAGRARIQDNNHYDPRTQEERNQQVLTVLDLEERPTALETIKLNLPVSYQDLGIDRIGVADVTLYGMCVHDYAMSPCTKGGECMICREHVCIKGMPDTLENMIKLETMTDSQYQKARKDSARGFFGADRWVTYLGWKLAHIRTQRKRLESEDTPEGAVLRISPDHDPSPIKRAFDQREPENESTNLNLEQDAALLAMLDVEDA